MKKRFLFRATGPLAAAAFSLVLLTGCGGQSFTANKLYSSNSMGDYATAETMAAAIPVPADPAYLGAPSAAASAEFGFENDGTYTAADSGSGSSSSEVPVQDESRKLIRNVDLSVETLEFDSFLNAIEKRVSELKGYVEQSSINNGSMNDQVYGHRSMRYASMSIRIPAGQLDAFLSSVQENSNVTYKTESVSDVTLQYADVASRLRTLRTEQDRLWELLEKAESTDAVIAIEQRLTEVSSDIESYESQMRTLDNQVSYSTVSMNIEEVVKETPTTPEGIGARIKRGFSKNLEDLRELLIGCAVWLVSSLPTLLFLAAAAVVVALIVRAFNKRSRKKKDANKLPPTDDNTKQSHDKKPE